MQRKALLSQAFNKQCTYCGTRMVLKYPHPASVSREHAVPKSKGGKTIIPACLTCNNERGDSSLFWFLTNRFEGDTKKATQVFNKVAKLAQNDVEREYFKKDAPSHHNGVVRVKVSEGHAHP